MNILYLSSPKTGRTSVHSLMSGESYYLSFRDINQLKKAKSNNVKFYHLHLHLSRPRTMLPRCEQAIQMLDNPFVFCTVRNPWDRLVSGFYYCGISNMTFRDFVINRGSIHLGKHDLNHTWINQVNFGIKNASMFLDLAHLKRDWSLFSSHVSALGNGVKINRAIGRRNVGKRKKKRRIDYRTQYDEKMIQVVREAFAEDFEFLKCPDNPYDEWAKPPLSLQK